MTVHAGRDKSKARAHHVRRDYVPSPMRYKRVRTVGRRLLAKRPATGPHASLGGHPASHCVQPVSTHATRRGFSRAAHAPLLMRAILAEVAPPLDLRATRAPTVVAVLSHGYILLSLAQTIREAN
ncbi:MAG: hypothetical protein UU76_C0024G0006 [Parcubacteria group bacterium GW2011_GWC1_41_7]|nr:MAG: hypothetical protein UU76_C0024G0006 [Parcubacteria group bacterium GW2011_GWC1_41_7]